MPTTLNATIKAGSSQDATNAAEQFEFIIKNTEYSEVDKRHRAVAFGLSVNDDGDTSAKLEFELLSDDQELQFRGTIDDDHEHEVMLEYKWTF